ncbi:hypothetical protein CANARDRAFT_60440 [[Candida] arabinofermentans NRRL YB-2248]|uniref:Uncharacterized protein n=1 Tax=[Candida] arabinofermentans NRRL YB-2248 TaxID=983967 RepID=A0A1E4SYI1_9ASCO|nr:hypothetical protein CANARDRAFT_60440 [[Candida] arabinofermentans NRRL YB-2248]
MLYIVQYYIVVVKNSIRVTFKKQVRSKSHSLTVLCCAKLCCRSRRWTRISSSAGFFYPFPIPHTVSDNTLCICCGLYEYSFERGDTSIPITSCKTPFNATIDAFITTSPMASISA